MAKKKYVSSNTHFYKHNEVGGATGHVNRVFNENKNAYDEYTKFNFGDENLTERYQATHRDRENKTGRKTRKDANTYCETVLAFSLEQYEHIEAEALRKANGDSEQARKLVEKAFTGCVREFEKQIQERFGLTPLGFNMHLDEGHFKEGELKRNIHAHVGWYNYDFKKGVSPWRKIGKKQLSEMQDIADRCFKKLGYERGIKATETNKQHLERDDFIEQKQKEAALKVKREQERADRLIEQNKQSEERLKATEKKKDALIEAYKEEAEKPAKLFQRFLFYAYDYIKSLFTESETIEKKEKYEKSRDDLEKENLSSEQKLMVNEIKADIEYQSSPTARLENRLKRKY